MDRPALTTEPPRAARREGWLLRMLVIAALVVTAVLPLTQNIVEPDLWGHVVYGEELLVTGKLPRTATHTFTSPEHPWYNHENLSEIALALGYRNLGIVGMLIVKALLGLAVLGAMHHVARRRGVPRIVAWSLLVLVAVTLESFFYLRPQLLSFAWCAAMLVMLHHAFADWRGDGAARCAVRWGWLLPMPLLMAVWINSHGGFLAGACILAAVFAIRSLEALLVERRGGLRVVAGLTAIGIASAAALLVNPYGAGLLWWLYESLGSPRPEIGEWLPPQVHNRSFWGFMGLIVVNTFAWAGTQRRRDVAHAIILVLVGWQSLMHLRHIAFFALLTGFWTTPHLHSTLTRLGKWLAMRVAWRPGTLLRAPALRGATCVVLVAGVAWQSNRIADRFFGLPVPSWNYPVEAFDFMAQNNVQGRIVIDYNWAQYALAAFPESTVAFDGRFRTCYPQEVVDMHFDFIAGENARIVSPFGVHRWELCERLLGDPEQLFPVRKLRHRSPSSGPIDPRRVLEHGDPEIVVVNRRYRHTAVRVMRGEAARSDSPWTLLYQDALTQVYGRKRVFDDPASDRYLPTDTRPISDEQELFYAQWPAMPRREPIEPTTAATTEAATVSSATSPAVTKQQEA